MKTLIIYYSFTGNNAILAAELLSVYHILCFFIVPLSYYFDFG